MNTTQNKQNPLGLAMKILVPILILALGTAAGLYFKNSAPKMKKKKPAKQIPVVEVIASQKTATPVRIQAMGTVVPAAEVTLSAQVGGSVVSTSDMLEPGGIVKKGDVLLRIDPRDYQIEVKRNKGEVASARAALKLEMGSQEVARKELEFMVKTAPNAIQDTSLALREPQLEQAEVKLETAEANLDKALLALERTTIKAPFNALITERYVTTGSQASTQTQLAQLVCTDEYWVEAAIPMDRLRYLDLSPDPGLPDLEGAEVRVTSQSTGVTRMGRALRLTGTFTDKTHMGNLLISVSDPLGLKDASDNQSLILGDFVTLEITGRKLKGVVPLPRQALRDDSTVWVEQNGSLTIRPVNVAWKDATTIYCTSGIGRNENVIVSEMTHPVEGMTIQVAGTAIAAQKDAPAQQTKQGQKKGNKGKNKKNKEQQS